MATIRDVARLAGVSVATVSHVINNNRRVLPQTRQVVVDAIETLKYRPSAIARSLNTQITYTIGIVVADITSTYFAELVRGIEQRLSSYGYNAIVCNTDEDPQRENQYLDLLFSRNVDAVVLASTGYDQPIFEEYRRRGTPVIFIDRYPPHPIGDVVTADNHKAGYDATRHILSLGHQRIAILAGSEYMSPSVERLDGYRHALEAHGLPFDAALVGQITEPQDDAIAIAKHLLTQPERPTAILATNQRISVGVLSALHQLNLKIPGDISVVCFGDHPLASVFSPPLTVVRQPTTALCDITVNTLIAQMAARQCDDVAAGSDVTAASSQRHVVESELIIRESCQPYAAAPTSQPDSSAEERL